MELNRRYIIQAERIHTKGNKEKIYPEEVKLLEISPSEKFVKFGFPPYDINSPTYGGTYWKKAEEVVILEELPYEH